WGAVGLEMDDGWTAACAVAAPLDAQPRFAVRGQQRGELTVAAPVGRQPAAGCLTPERHAGGEVLRREVEKDGQPPNRHAIQDSAAPGALASVRADLRCEHGSRGFVAFVAEGRAVPQRTEGEFLHPGSRGEVPQRLDPGSRVRVTVPPA